MALSGGRTIAGFFSDEPEMGNGHLYEQDLTFGQYEDLPWSAELAERLEKKLGVDYVKQLILLWEEEAVEEEKARIRYAYMDALTYLVEEDFSMQIGEWCREHGVKYIGHLIEDNNQHARLGSSLGHYYRGLAGQDMAGIDNIGGQVMPGQEEVDITGQIFGNRIGEFYHYMLGKLGSSAAAIEPLKNGDSMCEIFGAYGWSAGIRLQKYLIDHFMVRGINHFVPHAFSPKEFPDEDCPPHFYAHGNNPQYKHFGALMAYTNRVCELIRCGRHIAPMAVLYHGEGEWAGDVMFSHKVGHVLTDAQIEYDYIPQDVFGKREHYKTSIESQILKVNTQEYQVVIVPYMQFVTMAFAEAVREMQAKKIAVWFIESPPRGICDLVDEKESRELLESMRNCKIVGLEEIVLALTKMNVRELVISPADNRIRYYQYKHPDDTMIYLVVNEGESVYQGEIRLKNTGKCYIYDAWENAVIRGKGDSQCLEVTIEPLKSLIVVCEAVMPDISGESIQDKLQKGCACQMNFAGTWVRSICRSIDYPKFGESTAITFPDSLAEEQPKFSGFVRYENTVMCQGEQNVFLEITDAHEGVEVFVNGTSLGIQVVPPFRYDLSTLIQAGKNEVVIEVATTLERELADIPNRFRATTEATALSGITGEVSLYNVTNL